MTNHIQAEDLEAGDRFIDPEGNTKTVSRRRMIDHERVRLETREGDVAIISRYDTFLRAT